MYFPPGYPRGILMKSWLIIIGMLLLSACSTAQPNPAPLQTQDATTVAIAAEATVTAMAVNKPAVPAKSTSTAPPHNFTPTAQVVSQPKEFWIAYIYQNKLYLANGDGSNATLLTNTPGPDYLPIWSPDGKFLAFIRFDGENRQDGVLEILPNGSNTPHTLSNAGKFGNFAWLPGSRQILAARGIPGTYEIDIIDAATGTTNQIAKSVGETPRISPDGKSILLLINTGTPCDGKGCVTPNDYHMYDLATHKTIQLTGDGQSKMTLGWSPDGQLIAYTFYNDASGKAELMQPDGKLVSSKQDLPWWINPWKISPDGSMIAYGQNDTNHGSFDLFVRPVNGGETRKIPHDPGLTNGINYIDTLRWRPDGSGFVYNLFDKIYTVNVDGSEIRQIPVKLDNVFFDVRPSTDPVTPPVSPTAPSTWPICPGALDTRLGAGRQARVAMNPPNPNNVREGPGKQSKVIGQIQPGEKIEILSGPICDTGLIWWSIRSLSNGLQGYTLEGDLTTYWLEPIK
jgi:Tol biopolymer transport system component